MCKYINIRETVEKFYSEGNKITTTEYLDFFDLFELNQSEWKLLKLIYESPDNSSTATALAIKLDFKGHQAINLKFKRIAEKIANHTNKFPFYKKTNKYWWWTLLATGEKKGEFFYWKLRPELIEAINIFEKSQSINSADWKKVIVEWIRRTKKLVQYKNEFLTFFDKIINLAGHPDRAYFGTNNNTISIVVGHLYLGVYIHSGDDKGIGMIVEKDFKNIKGIACTPVKSTLAKTSPHKLYWLWIKDISNLHQVLNHSEIWQSFRKASNLVIETPQGKTTREREKKGKIVLSALAVPKKIIQEYEYFQELELSIAKAKKISIEKRKIKLREAPEIPEKIFIKTTGFKRNPYVIVEVLERANGICELCEKEAPFIKITDGLPFLEVHHIEPLANGGKDTIENAVALCPNCHREAHHGINIEEIKKKLLCLTVEQNLGS